MAKSQSVTELMKRVLYGLNHDVQPPRYTPESVLKYTDEVNRVVITVMLEITRPIRLSKKRMGRKALTVQNLVQFVWDNYYAK